MYVGIHQPICPITPSWPPSTTPLPVVDVLLVVVGVPGRPHLERRVEVAVRPAPGTARTHRCRSCSTVYPSLSSSSYCATATFAAEPAHGFTAKLIVVPRVVRDRSTAAAAARAARYVATRRSDQGERRPRRRSPSSPRLRDLMPPPFQPGYLPGSHLLLLLRLHGVPGTCRRTIRSDAAARWAARPGCPIACVIRSITIASSRMHRPGHQRRCRSRARARGSPGSRARRRRRARR